MSMVNDICPVCGMETMPDAPMVEYHRMFFHFCSAQCQKTFLAHPGLYSSKTGTDRHKMLKQRTMNLAEPLDDETRKLITSSLLKMMGVQEVSIEKGRVGVTYDLLQITEEQIEKILLEVGAQLGGGWLDRLRRSWVRDSEEIELDNLAAPPAPRRNRPPPGA